MRQIVLVVYNVRSAHNVGSILRTSDGLGVYKVCLTGHTPYPAQKSDKRLPHEAAKIDHRIHKTALGAEKTVRWQYYQNALALLDKLKNDGYQLVALEQTADAVPLHQFAPGQKLVLVVGSEVGGLEQKVLDAADQHIEIPMLGKKESFNVAIAAAIALYKLLND